MDILNPPEVYVKYRIAMHKWERDPNNTIEEFNKIRKEFYTKFPESEETIKDCFNYLQKARNSFSLPVERIELIEPDGKKHGRVRSAMLSDIEYWVQDSKLMHKKVYVYDQESPMKERINDSIREPGMEG